LSVLAALAVAVGVAANAPALAQNSGFGIDPSKLEFSLAPGASGSGTVVVLTRNETLPLVASLEDFLLDSTGDARMLPGSTLERSAAAWLAVTPDAFSLPAKGTTTVTVKVRVPPDPKLNGTYWTTVAFTPVRPPNTGGLAMNVRVALVVYVNVGQQLPKGVAGGLKWDAVNGLFRFTFQNKGNTVLRPKGALTLVNSAGVKVATLPVDDFACLPGGQLSGTVKLPAGARPPAGAYIAVLSFSSEGMKPVAAQISVQL
ncbi:MAG TPA: hypothetical protein VHN99_02810, partial [Deinococcales bacterium]|nr:hypothetical protein [Deinococcales bacterium]